VGAVKLLRGLKRRLPAWRELVLVFGVVVFVVHSWSVRGFLFDLPSFLLKLRPLEIAAVFCYHMAFAALESTAFTAALLVLTAVLPTSWLRQGFVHNAFVLVLAATAGAIVLQYSFAYGEFAFESPNSPWLLPEIVAGGAAFAVLYIAVHRAENLQELVGFIVNQVSVMLLIYLPLDALGIFTVAVRLLR
jgi:hypothetical protein